MAISLLIALKTWSNSSVLGDSPATNIKLTGSKSLDKDRDKYCLSKVTKTFLRLGLRLSLSSNGLLRLKFESGKV